MEKNWNKIYEKEKYGNEKNGYKKYGIKIWDLMWVYCEFIAANLCLIPAMAIIHGGISHKNQLVRFDKHQKELHNISRIKKKAF